MLFLNHPCFSQINLYMTKLNQKPVGMSIDILETFHTRNKYLPIYTKINMTPAGSNSRPPMLKQLYALLYTSVVFKTILMYYINPRTFHIIIPSILYIATVYVSIKAGSNNSPRVRVVPPIIPKPDLFYSISDSLRWSHLRYRKSKS